MVTPHRRSRAAITAVFAANGALFASLYSRLPTLQAELGLSEGELGLALLAAPIGLRMALVVVVALCVVAAVLSQVTVRRAGEIYPDVVDGLEEEGGVPSRLLKTDAGVGRQEGTPWRMFAGSPSRGQMRSRSRWMISREKVRGG